MAMDNIKNDDDVSKLRSFSALNTCNHEMQQEIANLGQEIISKDRTISNLRVRLAKYERTCMNDGDVSYFVGPSDSLVESLCKEIRKLKQKLKETEVDASQKLEYSKRELQSLQQKLREKEQELEHVRLRPEHQREQEIQRLQASLAERDRMQATKDVLCHSLTEEAEQLRGQLGVTVQMCQKLLGRLEKSRASSTEDRESTTEITDFSEVVHLNAVIRKLQRENEQLGERVAYVENLNSKWQRYDQSREQYVKCLCAKLREYSGLTQTQGQAVNRTASKALLQEEIGRLNGLLEEKMLECERISKEWNDRVLKDKEHIQMLEQQVLAYIEDFRSERADRERAQGKILGLQDDVARLQLQIHAQNAREASSTRRLHIGLKKPGHKQAAAAEPLLRTSPPDSSAKRAAGYWPTQDTGDLQCPLCLAQYDGQHTVEFLNHCEECASEECFRR